MLAVALGKSSEDFSTAEAKKDPLPAPQLREVRTALQPGPNEATGSITANQCARPWVQSLEE